MNRSDQPTYVGVDWASGCWVVVAITGTEACISTEPAFLNVWHSYGDDAEAILVDIPIGLSDEGPRACDDAAKKALEERHSTVFGVPCREAVEASTYEEARIANEAADCGGIGSQSWGLVSTIREVDVFLQEYDAAGESVIESHPEVCFWAFAEKSPPTKGESDGIEARLDILENEDQEIGEQVRSFVDERRDDNAEWHQRIQSGRIDDVLDAAVLALTAKTSHGSYETFPEETPWTESPVIVYPDTDS